jgi:Fibronectin type III domain
MRAAHRERFRTLPVMLFLLVTAPSALAQLPERTGSAVPPPVDPTLEPPLPAPEPRVSIDPAVQPGIILEERGQVLTRGQRYQVPGWPPDQLQVTGIGPRSVTLSWRPPQIARPGDATANAIGYRIHMARQGQEAYSGGGVVTESTATTDATLLPATTYSFKVSAMYPPESNLREGMSTAVSATLPAAAAPTGLKASVVGGGRVSLSWDALPGSDGLRLFRNDSMVAEFKRDTSSPISPFNPSPPKPMATSFADSVAVGTYQYQIRAVYKESAAESAAETVSAPAPTPPVSVTINPSTRVKYCQ